jgi:hypothetical protein
MGVNLIGHEQSPPEDLSSSGAREAWMTTGRDRMARDGRDRGAQDRVVKAETLDWEREGKELHEHKSAHRAWHRRGPSSPASRRDRHTLYDRERNLAHGDGSRGSRELDTRPGAYTTGRLSFRRVSPSRGEEGATSGAHKDQPTSEETFRGAGRGSRTRGPARPA